MLQFEDKHTTFTAEGYGCTNEEPSVFNEMLKGKHFNRIGAIASGGEVSFLSLLPRTKQLTAVDHSYRALAAFTLKAALLKDMGVSGFRSYLLTTDYDTFLKDTDKLAKDMPAPLTKHLTVEASRLFKHAITSSEWQQIRREWYYTTASMLARSRNRLDCVVTVHGDLRDIQDKAPFDLLYISNAMEHRDRNNIAPKLDDLKPLLKPGGLLLATGYQTSEQNFLSKGWKVLNTIRGIRTSWQHNLVQLEVAKPEAAQA